MDEHDRRVGINEALFREVNERVREIEEGFAVSGSPLYFVCECGDATCAERVALTREEYEGVRARSNRFVMVPGHEVAAVESIAVATERYVVIEKHPGAVTALADELDPRGDSD